MAAGKSRHCMLFDQKLMLKHICTTTAILQSVFCIAFSSFVVVCRGRVGLMPDSSLYIEVPKETDFGFYTCRATNHLGSTLLSFQLQKAGKKRLQNMCRHEGLFKVDEFVM